VCGELEILASALREDGDACVAAELVQLVLSLRAMGPGHAQIDPLAASPG